MLGNEHHQTFDTTGVDFDTCNNYDTATSASIICNSNFQVTDLGGSKYANYILIGRYSLLLLMCHFRETNCFDVQLTPAEWLTKVQN